MPQFAVNNNKSLFTKFSPNFITKILHAYMSFEKVEFLDVSICEQTHNQKALEISQNMQTISEFA